MGSLPLPIYHLPQGGSITIAGLVPLIWFALRQGFRYGLFTGFCCIGLSWTFKGYPLVGVGVGITGRFIASFLSGIIFFTSPTLEGAIAHYFTNSSLYLLT